VDLERLFALLSGIHPLSDEFKAAIEEELTLLSLPKNHMLLEAPRIAEHAFFLDSGFAMSYIYMKGQKQIENFWASGQIVISAKSFFEQVPCREFIKLMVQSEVLCVSYHGVLRLFKAFPEAHFIYATIMNQYYENSRERTHDMQHLNARDRYQKLLTHFPQIEQIIAQEYIASYLGIAPQSLSRLKRQMRGS